MRKDVLDAAGTGEVPESLRIDPKKGIGVDAKLAAGKGPTQKLPAAERAQARAEREARDKLLPRAHGQICMRCEVRKSLQYFTQLSRNPNTYDIVCLVCRAEDEAKDLRAEVLERGATRDINSADVRRSLAKSRKAANRARESEGLKRSRAGKKKFHAEVKIEDAAKRELARRELLRRKLLYFVHAFHPEYKAGWVHADICARLERFYTAVMAGDNPRLMLFCPPRHGKLCADSVPVLTPSGWVTHGDLEVGGYVYDPDGNEIRIVAVSDKGPADWVLDFSNGEHIRCHGEHEWTVFNRRKLEWSTRETKDFVGNRGRDYALPIIRLGLFGVENAAIYGWDTRVDVKQARYDPNGEVGHCIEVDSESGLYLVGERLLPTHNSALASKLFPAWAFGQNPRLNIIASSYGLTLPTDFSRYVKAKMSEELYVKTFPKSGLNPKKTNVENWGLEAGGEYIAAGVGTGIGGRGADILIIDDPLKDAQEADSETIRNGVFDWFKSTAYTRLSPTSGVLIILTRWHDADLAGALIEEELELVTDADSYFEAEIDALTNQYRSFGAIPKAKLDHVHAERDEMLENIDRWEVVSYPAVAEHDEFRMPDGRIVHEQKPKSTLLRVKGEALHESRWPLSRLMRIYNGYKRRNMRHWHSLYQQKPVPDEGEFFTIDMFHEKDLPASYIWKQWTVLQAWDLAIGLKQQHNYTVGITGVLDPDDTMWIINVVRGRWDIDGIANQILDTYDRYRPVKIGVERGPLELALMPAITRTLRKRNRNLRPGQKKLTPYFLTGKQSLVPISDKLIRARPLQGLMQQGGWIWTKGAPWLDNVKHEMVRFPSGVLEDCVDAAAWLAHVAVNTPAPREQVNKDAWSNRDVKSWRDRLSQLTGRDESGGYMGA